MIQIYNTIDRNIRIPWDSYLVFKTKKEEKECTVTIRVYRGVPWLGIEGGKLVLQDISYINVPILSPLNSHSFLVSEKVFNLQMEEPYNLSDEGDKTTAEGLIDEYAKKKGGGAFITAVYTQNQIVRVEIAAKAPKLD